MTDEVFVLGDLFTLEADAMQVEPQQTIVALDPIDLKRAKTKLE